MSRPNKYQAQATLGIAGLFLIASPLFIKLPSQFQSFNSATQLSTELAQKKAQVEASEDLERARIEKFYEHKSWSDWADIIAHWLVDLLAIPISFITAILAQFAERNGAGAKIIGSIAI